MKKLLALLLCLCILAPACIALAEITYPLENGPTFKVWYDLDAGNSQMYTNLAESPVWQRYQELTGVKLEFMHPTYGAAKEGFSLMIANQDDWPDIIIDFASYYNGGTVTALEDEVIWDLTPYLEEYAPDYYALINRDARTHIEFYNEDDQCLAFDMFAVELNPSAYSYEVRADWCEEWGIDVASLTTFDAIEVYFQKIKEEKPGVVPYMPIMSDKKNLLPVMLMGYDLTNDFMVIDGQIVYYANQDNYREFLRRYHSWYEKGYIGVDFTSLKNATVRKQFAAGEVGCFTVAIGNGYADAQAAGIAMDKTPYWRVSEDMVVHTYSGDEGLISPNEGYGAVATRHMDESLLPVFCQFMNYFYTDSGLITANYGPEGVSWDYDENGNIKHNDWVMNNPDNTTSVMHNVCRFNYWPHAKLSGLKCNPNIIKDPVITELRGRYRGVNEYFNTDYILPYAVSLTADEASDRDSIMTDVEAFVMEWTYKFIDGTADLDADWDSYVKELEHYKLGKAISITQDAYNRYLERLAAVAE